MKLMLKTTLACALAGLYTASSQASGVSIDVEIPRIETAQYHRPYVAVWLQSPDRKIVRDIAVWYDYKMPKAEGAKWLKDMRQWWRVSGRSQNEPADGITGATQPVGKHTIKIDHTHTALAELPPGSYELMVEAAREKGGREVLRLPLPWPVHTPVAVEAKGESELGKVVVTVSP